MIEPRRATRRRLRGGTSAAIDGAVFAASCVALLTARTRLHRADQHDRAEKVRALFTSALAEFSRNVNAWQRGMTDAQVRSLRALCRERGVQFEPDHYSHIDTGHAVGWIGGPSYSKPPSCGGTVYVGVARDGTVTGVGGSAIKPPPTNLDDGKESPQ
jgi:hypothetical protein